jgi:hypothetical protein
VPREKRANRKLCAAGESEALETNEHIRAHIPGATITVLEAAHISNGA